MRALAAQVEATAATIEQYDAAVERAYVLYRGEVVEEGPVDELFDSPQHWYTKKLIASLP